MNLFSFFSLTALFARNPLYERNSLGNGGRADPRFVDLMIGEAGRSRQPASQPRSDRA